MSHDDKGSITPRTDAIEAEQVAADECLVTDPGFWAMCDHARQLERELSEALDTLSYIDRENLASARQMASRSPRSATRAIPDTVLVKALHAARLVLANPSTDDAKATALVMVDAALLTTQSAPSTGAANTEITSHCIPMCWYRNQGGGPSWTIVRPDPEGGWIPLYAHPAPSWALNAVVEQWIPVSERLPDIGERVLVAWKSFEGEPRVGERCRLIPYEGAREFFWQYWNSQHGLLLQEAVTHWMPLPEAPRSHGGHKT